MSEAFGFDVQKFNQGQMNLQMDQANLQLAGLTITENQEKLASMRTQRQMQQAMAEAAQKARQQQQQKAGAQSPADLVQPILAQVQVLEDYGNPAEAAKLLHTLSQTNEQSALAGEHQADLAIKSATIASTAMASVGGTGDVLRASVNQAIMHYTSMMPDMPPDTRKMLEALRTMPDAQLPQAVEQIRNGIETSLERANRMKATLDQEKIAVDTKLDKSRIGLVEAQTRAAEARTKADKKNGNKEPDAAAVTDALNIIATKKDTDKAAPIAAMYARDTAERAMTISQELSIPLTDAVKRAYKEMDTAGYYAGLKDVTESRGARGNPLQVPMVKDSEDPSGKRMIPSKDPKAYKPGMAYRFMYGGKPILLYRTKKPLDDPDAFTELPEESQ